MQARFNDARRLGKTLNILFDGALQEGLGPPGEPGDVETLAFVAEAIGDLYQDALMWSVKLRTANLDERFQTLVSIVGGMMDHLIERVEAFGPYVKRTVEEALAASRTDEPSVLTMTLTVAVPDNALRAFNEELSRLQAEE